MTASSLATLERWSAALDLRDLRARFGSCLSIVSAPQLRHNLAAWQAIAGAADRICYPVKANPTPAVLELLAAQGARAERASPAEVRRWPAPSMAAAPAARW